MISLSPTPDCRRSVTRLIKVTRFESTMNGRLALTLVRCFVGGAGCRANENYRPPACLLRARKSQGMVPTMKATRMSNLLRVMLSLQFDGWMGLQAEDPSLQFSAISKAAKADASSVHGLGLFTKAAISAGEIVAFYPVRALGDTTRRFEDDASADVFGGLEHKPYRVALPASPGLIAWGASDLWVDTDPNDERQVNGWLGHLVNDACVCASDSDEDILAYYRCAASASNCRLVSFGDTPLICFVTTEDIAQGEEILGSYGHDHWCAASSGNVPPYTAVVAEAEQAWQATSSSWRRRVQSAYQREIEAVARLVDEQVYS